MAKNLYSIHDSVLDQFKDPWPAQNEKEATRAFHRAYLDNRSDFCMFPAHFNLYEVAVFNEESGVISPIEPPRFCIGATSFVKES